MNFLKFQIMSLKITFCNIVIVTILLLVSSIPLLRINYLRIPFMTFERNLNPPCFQWKSLYHYFLTESSCQDYSQVNSLIWTYDGTGLMKYIQWIVIRKLAKMRITRLNDDCHIAEERFFPSESMTDPLIQVYIIAVATNLANQSKCATKIHQIANVDPTRLKQIYFKRRSVRATVFFQQLDSMTENFNITPSLNNSLVEQMINFTPKQWTNINSEDLIQSNLTDCERVLTSFLSALGLNTSLNRIQNIIENDSYQFLEDATWWDQSEVAERLVNQSIPSYSGNFTYTNDFYYLHGNQSFTEYLYRSRRCYHEGLFPQWQSENITRRSSMDNPDRCAWKPFDCAFSDIYSFADREQMYQLIDSQYFFNEKPLKCGFAVPTVFDQIRKIYARNDTCKTIIFTAITNCYDPLPIIVQDTIIPSSCFIALLDTKTINAYKNQNNSMSNITWDFVDLGFNATTFSAPAKSSEILKIVGLRLFPLAKWIIWLDGKARVSNLTEILIQARAPFIGASHPISEQTSATEVDSTIGLINVRLQPGTLESRNSILDITTQQEEYKRDGFYSRSDALKLKMFDIAGIAYRNHHPCIYRYLCAWHNEVAYYSYRGQLSVYYPAERMNLTNYFHFIPIHLFNTSLHQSVC